MLLLKARGGARTAAIGDGGNDVAMIQVTTPDDADGDADDGGVGDGGDNDGDADADDDDDDDDVSAIQAAHIGIGIVGKEGAIKLRL